MTKTEDISYCSVSAAGTTKKVDVNQHFEQG